MYVIRNTNGKLVSYPGSANSFTNKVARAQKFYTEEEAQKECCGNEWPLDEKHTTKYERRE